MLIGADSNRIQPAGWIHRVYTLANSIFTGGHFFMLDGMHLTEMTRACIAATNQVATNAVHPGCVRTLCRIVLALLFNNHETGKPRLFNPSVHSRTDIVPSRLVLRKPFISLARMIIWPEIYARGDVDPKGHIFERSNEAKLEQEVACAAAELILEHNHIKLEDIRPKPLEKLEWLAAIDPDLDWNDPGTAMLAIPDVRYMFRAFEDVNLENE